ncbi:hypothetical protein J6590_082904 [Homalodisca vitripennis]|nr:hypothetical protein J6590_082904 [Homalodisca vitripennis]
MVVVIPDLGVPQRFVLLEQRLSQDNRIKQRRAWLLLGWVTAEQSCPCRQPVCPAVGRGLDFAGTIPWDDIRSTLGAPVTARRKLFTAVRDSAGINSVCDRSTFYCTVSTLPFLLDKRPLAYEDGQNMA